MGFHAMGSGEIWSFRSLSSWDILLFGFFDSVFRAASSAFLDALTVQGSSNDMISHTIQVLHAPTTKKNNAVFLQVVTFIRNVCNYFMSCGKATLATFLIAEFGFFGVRVVTCTQTPRRNGQALRAGDFVLDFCKRRPFRTSWLIVGIE